MVGKYWAYGGWARGSPRLLTVWPFPAVTLTRSFAFQHLTFVVLLLLLHRRCLIGDFYESQCVVLRHKFVRFHQSGF